MGRFYAIERYKLSLQLHLGDFAKRVRARFGLSQEQMAELLHITVRSYSDLERKRCCFSMQTFLFLLFILEDAEILQLLAVLRELAKEAEHESI